MSTNNTHSTILYVEDNPLSARLLRKNLQAFGYNHIGADSALKGIRLAQQHQPDLIILDLSLPDFGGIEVISTIRNMPRLATVPIIILTGDPNNSTAEACRVLGADDYLIKPVSRHKLKSTIEKVFAAEQSTQRTSNHGHMARINHVNAGSLRQAGG